MKSPLKTFAVVLSAVALIAAGGPPLFAGEKGPARNPSTPKKQMSDKSKEKKPATAYEHWKELSKIKRAS